jgi:hypothetical protein
MKWIGQHIWDFTTRFRNDVYLESLADHGSDPDRFLTMDSTTGKITYRTGAEVFSDIGAASGDITSVIGGTNCTVSGGSSGDATVNVDDAFLVNSGSDTTTGTITAAGFTTTGTWTFDEYSSGTIGITTVQDSGTAFNDNDTSLLTAAAIDDRIRVASKHVLRCNAFYLNDNPMVQNSLYFGNSVGNSPWNFNDPAAVGGVIGDTSSFTIIGDDENWGIVLPMNISKIEVQCSLRPGLGGGDDFTIAIYTGVRSTDSAAALTLTKIGHESVSFSTTSNNYTRNDIDVSADLNKGTMIYVGVGSEDSTSAKNARGYMNITVTER